MLPYVGSWQLNPVLEWLERCPRTHITQNWPQKLPPVVITMSCNQSMHLVWYVIDPQWRYKPVIFRPADSIQWLWNFFFMITNRSLLWASPVSGSDMIWFCYQIIWFWWHKCWLWKYESWERQLLDNWLHPYLCCQIQHKKEIFYLKRAWKYPKHTKNVMSYFKSTQ